jgi:hypothetical protein
LVPVLYRYGTLSIVFHPWEKDYEKAIISGFESCGLFPLNAERALAKLPKENRDVESAIQQQLLDRLSSMRYSQPETTHASRPRKKDKLPAGASYTCLPGQKALVGLPVDKEMEMEEMAVAFGEGSPGFIPDPDSSDTDSEEMTRVTNNIIDRLDRTSKRKRTNDDQESFVTSDSDSEDREQRKRKANRRRYNWMDEFTTGTGSWDSEEEDEAGVYILYPFGQQIIQYRTRYLYCTVPYRIVSPPQILFHVYIFTFSSFSLPPVNLFPQNSIGRYGTVLIPPPRG